MSANSVRPDDDMYTLKGRDLENYGFARVRDLAYDAVQELWRKRKIEGWTQVHLAANIDRDTGWLSRYLQGPGNWTFRTFGALVEGLQGVVEIRVRPAEDVSRSTWNESPYSGYVVDVDRRPPAPSSTPIPVDLFSPRKSKAVTTSELERSL